MQFTTSKYIKNPLQSSFFNLLLFFQADAIYLNGRIESLISNSFAVRMEGSNPAPAEAASSSSSSSSSHSRTASSDNAGRFGAGSSLTMDPHVEEEDTQGDEAGHPQLRQQRMGVSDNAYEENLQVIRVSCAVVIPSFWFFGSLAMIFGIYGSSNFQLGPNSSILIRPNPLFVQYLKVEELEKASNQPTLYGFYRSPPLDVVTTCFGTYRTFLPSNSHKEWVYFLNKGSQINVSYIVNSLGSSPLIFIIAQGNEGLSEWLGDPSFPISTLSRNTIQGSGMIQQDIYMSSSYSVAVANLNAEAVEVQLKMKIRGFLYNTSGAYYKCSLTDGECNLELFLNEKNIALLTSPCKRLDRGADHWNIKLSYGPRWMTYIVGTVIVTVIVLLLFRLLNYLEHGRRRRIQHGDIQSERTPLISNKDDDLSSWGSSYDSFSQDDEDLERRRVIGLLKAKPTREGEHNYTLRLCAICFDAPRDCFFLPCGHSVACFACGTRRAEAAAACPICQRQLKKVRKIFAV